MIKEIIPPVPKELLIQELTEDKFIRKTNFAGNEIYIFTQTDSPQLMKEIGRLREHTFRNAGGGTGSDVDIDEFDISDDPYQQLIVWGFASQGNNGRIQVLYSQGRNERG